MLKLFLIKKIAGRQLKEIHEKLYNNATSNKVKFTIEEKNDVFDVTYRPDFNFFLFV